MSQKKPPGDSRRTFLKTSAAIGAAAIPVGVHAAAARQNDTLKIALIGCGGRGGGAAINALTADPNVKITALCDIFPDRIDLKLKDMQAESGGKFKDRIDVGDRKFSGFDGYKQAIDSGVDMVILATSPGFRPLHFAYAVEKDKHVFMEKPHAVDATGIRAVIDTARQAEKKGLGVCGGCTYRFDLTKREVMKRIHDGVIGDITAIHSTFLTGGLWHRGDNEKWSEMEKQIRNWYYYDWLSGDFIVEQAIHNFDKVAWVMNGEFPKAAIGMGGRQVRTDPKWGNIYDHFSIVLEYASGAKAFVQCRQNDNCQSLVMDHIIGTKGNCQLMQHRIEIGDTKWKPEKEVPFGQAYVTEHEELLQSIRAGKPMNDGVRSAMSTLMAIMGREAAYTGRRITWEEIMGSKQSLVPKEFAWGPNKARDVAMPGKTKFV